MRKFLLLILLFAGLVLIFSPLVKNSPVSLLLNASAAHPSRTLPKPWHDSTPVQIQPPSVVDAVRSDAAKNDGTIPTSGDASSANSCADREIQAGETLGEIARDCNVPLADLLAANPQITDPNHIYAGQAIAIPDPRAGRGGGDSLEVGAYALQPGGYQPGAAVNISAEDLPANAPVRVGVGLGSSGYQVLTRARTGSDGTLSVTVRLPDDAQPGETAFILITVSGPSTIQRVSPTFTIRQP